MDKFFNHAVKSRNKQIMVWAKVKGKPIAIKVNNGKWPDNIEYSYNLITDTVNHTTLVLASPYSESGDWDIDYLYYFDANGKLFSFERRTGFFNSECTTDDDAAHETITYYYNSQFKQIRKFYRLQDSKGRNLIKSKCILNYDFTDYKIYKTLNDCLKGNHINIQ
ncbi:hypothetical protein [Mucilaginibacter polytrichastri]|uniref:Uncharacterized protein n=1 Tax=Mucilaginibacter polytrichastri TaxID=1302689 RepID=A0A1Q6A2L8_9SPHI|nr:hypothetical protein [Mucilaginibacter polytrichastri]OKS88265.1 hypothetical protein RG47T_3731 [Mucilaginibacter polytrichastri]